MGLLPTPVSTDTKNRKPGTPHRTKNGTIRHVSPSGQQSFMRLSQVVQLLPTPIASDYKTVGAAQSLPTPTVNDSKNSSFPPSQKDRDSLIAKLTPAVKTKCHLSPVFVEAMMGFPVGWTDLSAEAVDSPWLMEREDLPDWMPLATDSESVANRKQRLQALGNAVVPQVAAIALQRVLGKHRGGQDA